MKKSLFSIGFYWLTLVATAIFLYGLTAPNLVLTTWAPYWRWQTWMWHTFFNNRIFLTQTYLVLSSLVIFSYLWLLKVAWQNQKALQSWFHRQPKQALLVLLISCSPLLLAMNGLSYDLFNYAFNAKMVLYHHANPHVKVALDFANDPWVRFMHNTHTPAPYGYGWTAISLVPYAAGMGKLLPTWLLFKLFSLVSLGGLAWWYLTVFQQKSEATSWHVLLVLLNPLLLIEVLMNGHNDLWMMVPALASLWMVGAPHRQEKPLAIRILMYSFLLLVFSISIKLATIVLLPIWVGLVAINRLTVLRNLTTFYQFLQKYLVTYWPAWSALALGSLLCIERSKLFLPWYWSWILIWLPLIPAGKLRQLTQALCLGFSFSSLLRYLPYLARGEYTATVTFQQVMITFGGGVIFSLLLFLVSIKLFKPRRDDSHQVE